MNIKGKLEELGLTEKEAAVYMALLSSGQSSAIATADKAGIKRPTTYLVLEELRKKGLVTKMPRKRKALYFAENPEVLYEKLERQRNAYEDILPDLIARYNPSKREHSVKFYEGIEGIKEVYRDTIREKKDIVAFTAVKDVLHLITEFAYEEYLPNRIKYHIHAKVIGPDTPEARAYQKEDKKFLRETRLIKTTIKDFSIEKNIYGNKIGILSYKDGEEFGVIIESPEIAKSERALFELVWNSLN